MPALQYLLISGFLVAITGFIVAALSESRMYGIVVFMSGFFIVSAAIVLQMLTSSTESYGRVGIGLKVAAVGFAILVIGQLIELLLNKDGVIGNASFTVGIVVMVLGILLAILKLAKSS